MKTEVLPNVVPPAQEAADVLFLSPEELRAEQVVIAADSFAALSAEVDSFMSPGWRDGGLAEDRKSVERVAAKLMGRRVLGVNTETSMDPEKKARLLAAGKKLEGDLSSRLCLIQLGFPNQKIIEEAEQSVRALIEDPSEGETFLLSVIKLTEERELGAAQAGRESTNPLQPLKKLLEDENITKFEHNAVFEQRQFLKYGIRQCGVVDTMRLAKQFRSDLPSYSLAAVALEVCGIVMDKGEQKSEWDELPYREDQLRYARLDPELTVIVGLALLGWLRRAETETQEVRQSGDIHRMVDSLRALELERERLLEASGIREEEYRLRVRAARYEDYLKKELLPRMYEEMKAAAAEGEPEPRIEIEGVFGKAHYKRKKLWEPDWIAIEAIDPEMLTAVKRPHTTQTRINEEVRKLKESGVKGLTQKGVWDATRRDAGWYEPNLKIAFFGLSSRENFETDMQALAIPEGLSVDDCLREILQAKLSRARLLRVTGLGNQLGLINRKQTLISDVLLEALVSEAEAEEGKMPKYERFAGARLADGTESAAVGFSRKKKVETDYEKLRELYPEIYAGAVTEVTSKASVLEALRARGFDNLSREALISDLFKESETPGSLEARAYPAYGHYYKNEAEEEGSENEEFDA